MSLVLNMQADISRYTLRSLAEATISRSRKELAATDPLRRTFGSFSSVRKGTRGARRNALVFLAAFLSGNSRDSPAGRSAANQSLASIAAMIALSVRMRA